MAGFYPLPTTLTAQDIADANVAKADLENVIATADLTTYTGKGEFDAEVAARLSYMAETTSELILKADQTSLDSTNNIVTSKADESYVDAFTSGSPQGTYATLLDLQTAFPTGTTGVYIVTADGKLYSWVSGAWTAGGVYQATGIADGGVATKQLSDFSITPKKIIAADIANQFTLVIGTLSNTGTNTTSTVVARSSNAIFVKAGSRLVANNANNKVLAFAYSASTGLPANFIAVYNSYAWSYTEVTIPIDCYVRVAIQPIDGHTITDVTEFVGAYSLFLAGAVDGGLLTVNSVDGTKIKDLSITNKLLAPLSVDDTKIINKSLNYKKVMNNDGWEITSLTNLATHYNQFTLTDLVTCSKIKVKFDLQILDNTLLTPTTGAIFIKKGVVNSANIGNVALTPSTFDNMDIVTIESSELTYSSVNEALKLLLGFSTSVSTKPMCFISNVKISLDGGDYTSPNISYDNLEYTTYTCSSVYKPNVKQIMTSEMVDDSIFRLTETANYLPTAYIGQVATRCKTAVRSVANVGGKMMSKVTHYAMDNIINPKILIQNWYGSEVSPVGTATVKVAIEYPFGVFTLATFNAANTYVIPSGETAITDEIPVTIPFGEKFWTRTYIERTDDTVLMSDIYSPFAGDGFVYGATATDQTMGGDVPTSTYYNFAPLAIIASTRKPSIGYIGDSRVTGLYSAKCTNRGNQGEFSPILGQIFSYMDLSVGGESGSTFITKNAKRSPLLNYCSHIVCQYGINDLLAGHTGATVKNDLITIVGYYDKPFYLCTVPPRTTSTDGWVTAVNQAHVTWEAERVVLNTAIRLREISTIQSFFDVSNVVETDFNSGIWKPNYTGDGLHEATLGIAMIQASNIINPTLFTIR